MVSVINYGRVDYSKLGPKWKAYFARLKLKSWDKRRKENRENSTA